MKDDTISRQAAIDVMCELMHHWFGGDPKDEVREIKRELEKLPAVQPEVIHCLECRHHHYEKDIPYCDRIDYGYGWKDNDFCSRGERRTDERPD